MTKLSENLGLFFKKSSLLITEVIQRFSKGQGVVYSAYLAFYLLLSIFPFIMAIIGIMGFIPFDLNGALNKLIEFFPAEIHSNLIIFIESNRPNAGLFGYSLFFLLWSSARAIGAIRKALDRISGDRSRHNFIKARFIDSIRNFIFIFSLLIILFIPTAIRLTRLGTLLFKINIPYFLNFIETFQWLFIFGMLFGLISLVYMRMGTKKYIYKDVWAGALLTALGWALMSYLFNGVVSLTSSLVYGVFNIVIALLLWFQINMNIFIVGAHINQILIEKRINNNEES